MFFVHRYIDLLVWIKNMQMENKLVPIATAVKAMPIGHFLSIKSSMTKK